MRTLTTAADTASKRSYAAPRYLVRIDFTAPSALTLRISDQFLSAIGEEWLPLVADWGTLESALNSLDTDGRPATAELTLFNTKPVGGKDRVSDLIRSSLGRVGTYEWAGAKVTVYQLFDGQSAGDEVTLGVYYLEEPTDLGDDLITVRMSDITLLIEDKLIMTRISRDAFPNAPKVSIDTVIPRPFGVLTGVKAIPIVDGDKTLLNGALTSGATTVTVDDTTGFPATGSILIDAEIISYTGTTATTFTGCTRGAESTTAAAHDDNAAVYEVRSGSKALRYVVGENAGDYKIKTITNIRVHGEPALTSPGTTLDETALATGKSVATIDFTPSVVKSFYTKPAGGTVRRQDSNTSVAGAGVGVSFTLSRSTEDAELPAGQSVSVKLAMRVAAGSIGTNGEWNIRRAVGGAYTILDKEEEATTGITVNDGNSRGVTTSWDTKADLVVDCNFASGTAASVTVEFTVDYEFGSGAGAESTAALVIGDVTCDVEGLQDDGSGTISGTANLLLENPADINRLILTELYPGVDAADLGTSWTATRSRLAEGAYEWAFLLDEREPFAALRKKMGEQCRSLLYVEAGKFELKYLADAPDPNVTLDYEHDVDQEAPVLVRRTPRTDVRNSLNVSSDLDPATGEYRRLATFEDLAQPGLTDRITYDLALPWVRDAATAAKIGAYWLSAWKQQLFEVELLAYHNVLALEQADYLAVSNHPILAAHGGAGIVFRIIKRQSLPAEGRTRLWAVEAPTIVDQLISAILLALGSQPRYRAPARYALSPRYATNGTIAVMIP